MTVVDEFVLEVLQDEEYVDSHIDTSPVQCMVLSFSSFMGISSPTTMKIKGAIWKGDVLFMLDSGATHNFITPTVAQRLKLKEAPSVDLNILLGTGVTVKGSGICRDVSFTIQGWTFITNFITLDLE